jgi:branched-chain amino acid transport system permease protein
LVDGRISGRYAIRAQAGFMEIALVSTVNGIVLSAIYIMVALGLALLLSIMGIFNFAHGAIYMVGAFLTYGLTKSLGVNQWASLLISMIVIGAFGLFLEKFCFRPFGGRAFEVIVMSVALILILETAVVVTVGGSNRALPPFIKGKIIIGVVSLSIDKIITLIIGIILLILLTLLIQKTKIGQQMLAVAQDREGAALQGINVNRTAAIATVIACILAALSGSLMSSLYYLGPFMGDGMLMKAIEIVILSGIGSFGGILAGGLIIGFMDAVLPVAMNPLVAQAITIGIIIIILLIRPKGLFGYELF